MGGGMRTALAGSLADAKRARTGSIGNSVTAATARLVDGSPFGMAMIAQEEQQKKAWEHIKINEDGGIDDSHVQACLGGWKGDRTLNCVGALMSYEL